MEKRRHKTRGKVDSVTTKQNPSNRKFDVSLTITIQDGLNYEESEKLLEELRKEYLDKEVDLEHHKEPWPL